MNAKEISEKYVYGKHNALTDKQEVIDMTKDIEDYAQLMTDSEIRLAIYLDMDKSVVMQKSIEERVEEIFQYIKNGLTKYEV